MQVCFWGVRGSFPKSRGRAWRYGGNTPCVEVRAGAGTLILDAGSGIQDLGRQLVAELAAPGLSVPLLLTHYHWDHIQGLPSFEPIYAAGNRLEILGPHPQGAAGLPGVLETLFRAPFFPVSTGQLKSSYELRELDWESSFALGETRVRTCRLYHPQGAVAYRLEHAGASLVYATDHEPGHPASDRALRELARGADLLISDAQYTPEELPQKKGWGHSSWESAVALARDAGAKNLVLFHHDPLRTDYEIDEFLTRARRAFPSTWAATEGMLFEITARQCRVGWRRSFLTQPAAVLAALPAVSNDPAAQPRTPAAAPPSGATPRAARRGGNGFTPVEAPPPSPSLVGAPQPAQRGRGSAGENDGFAARGVGASARRFPVFPPSPEQPAAKTAVAVDSAPAPPSGILTAQRRHANRLSLEGTNAYGILRNGSGGQVVRALDVSSGGVGLLLEGAASLPEVFHVHLNVPVLPVADFRIRRVYTQALAEGLWRVGCRFSA